MSDALHQAGPAPVAEAAPAPVGRPPSWNPRWWSVEGKVAAAFVAAVLVLLGLGAVTYQLARGLVDDDRWVAHTHEVLTELADVATAGARASSAQRGYILTGGPTFLTAYQEATATLGEHLDRVAGLTAGNPVQVANVPELRAAAAAAVALLERDLDVYRRNGFAAARTSITAGATDPTRRRIRASIERMEREERRLLVFRTDRAHRRARQTFLTFTVVTAVQLGLLASVYRLVARELRYRRLFDEQLRRSRQLLSSVLDSSPSGVVACRAVRDPAAGGRIVDFTFQLASAAAERLVGHSAVDLVGRRMLALFPGNVETGLFDRYALVVTTGMPYDGEQHYDHDGLSVWLHIVAVPLGDDGIAITFGDISGRKRADADTRRYTGELEAARDATIRLAEQLRAQSEQLDVARRAAEAASVAKDNFLANMSHEIRTPIAAIIGYADLLLDPRRRASARLNDKQSIRRNGRHLLSVINDVLDLSKIEAGGMTVEPIETDLPRLAAEAVSITRPTAIEAGLDLSVRFDTPVPRLGRTDPLRLRQALINLIGNAVKFTRSGSVVLRVTCDGPHDANAVVRFDVIDTGRGMTDVELGRLFQPFVQGDVSTTRQFGGTGLGLTISRQFARLLGGDITVESRPGVGSTFTLTVGVGSVAAEQMACGLTEAGVGESQCVEDPTPADALAGVRVLLAEDGVDNREIISAYLLGAGASIDMVEDGRRAVAAARAATGVGAPFNVILMDMQMPVLDGYAATSELRRLAYAGPVLALTAHAMAEDRAKCLAAGCDDYLTKPIDRHTLVATVARYAGGVTDVPAGQQVIVAEDGPDDRRIRTADLGGGRATAETTKVGPRAIHAASTAQVTGRPTAVVLMAKQMPVQEGYGPTSELRPQEYGGPPIALTPRATFDDRVKCLAVVGDDYLSDPVEWQARVDARTPVVDVQAVAGLAPVGGAAVVAPAAVPRRPSTGSVRSALAGDRLLAPVVAAFVARLPATAAELLALAQAGARGDLARVAHKLRGAGGSYGFAAVSAAAAELEDRLLAGEPTDAVGSIADLMATLRQVEGYDAEAERAAPPAVRAA